MVQKLLSSLRRRPLAIPRSTAYLAFMAIAGSSHTLFANANTWYGLYSSSWNDPNNWSGHAPSPGDDLSVNKLGGGILFEPTLSSSSYSSASLLLEQGAVLTQTGGALAITGLAQVGNINGQAFYDISNGTLSASTLSLYSLGEVNQSGGTVTATNLEVGADISLSQPPRGLYNLSGGTLNATHIIIGNSTMPAYSSAVFTWSGGTLSSTISDITLNDGGTFALSGAVTGTLPSSMAIPLGGTSGDNQGGIIDVISSSGSLTVNGVVSGSASLTKTDNGSLTLTNTNTYSGGTNIDGGVVVVTADNNLGASCGSLTLNGGVLEVGGTGFTSSRSVYLGTSGGAFLIATGGLTVTNVVSGPGLLEVAGGGTLTLSGSNTYSGGTYILSGGTVSISANNGLGNSTGGVEIGNGTLEFTGNVSTSRSFTLDAGGTNTIDLSGTTLNTVVTGTVSGAGGLTLKGAGDVYLYGTNSYSGGTTITNGTVVIVDADANLGSTGTTLTLSGSGLLDVNATFTLSRNVTVGTGGGEIYIQTGGLTIGNVVSGAGRLIVGGGGGMVTLSGVNTYTGGTDIVAGGKVSISADSGLGNSTGAVEIGSGTLEFTGNVSTSRAFTLDAGGTNTIDLSGVTLTTPVTGTISGAGGLTLQGAGYVYLTGTNSYSGGTTITNGTVVIVNADANLGSTGTTLALSGDGLLDVSGTFTLSRNVTVGTGGGEIYIQTGGLTIGNVVSGAGRLIVGGGGGMVTLSGVNTYTGGTDIVAGGTVSISADSGLGNSTGAVEIGTGTLQYTGSSASTSRAFTLDAGTDAINVTSGSAIFTITGTVSGAGGITNQGVGTLELSGANTYSGGTTISAGTVQLGSATGVGSGNVTVSPGATFDLNGQVVTATTPLTLSDSGVGGNGALLNSNANPASWAGNITLASNSTIGTGNLTLSGVITGTGNTLTILGPGVLTLSGNNTYSGGTILNNGTLAVTNTTGSATGTGNVTLNGGTLIGNGTISGTVLGGSGPHTINPGITTTAANLTLGGLSTNSNTTLAFDLTSPESPTSSTSVNDTLIITGSGSLTLNGGTLVIASNLTGNASLGYYTAIQYTGSIGGTGISSLTLPAITNNVSYTLELTKDPGYIDIHRGFIGDANDSGNVDLTDLNIVLNNLGTTTTLWTMGNFDGSVTIDLTDLNDVLNNLGTSIGMNAVVGGNYQGLTVYQRLSRLEQLVWTMHDPLTTDEITEIQNYAESLGLFAPITPDNPSAEPALAASFKGVPDFQAVPEPCSLALLAPVGGLLLKRGRRRN